LMDITKREYSGVKFDPDPDTQKSKFNLWSGFSGESLRPELYLHGMTRAQIETFVMAPIMRHFLDVVTDGNLEHANWIIDWMAWIVQFPWKKTQASMLLYGLQGCGKSMPFEWFRKDILGETHSFHTANPSRDLFGRFSDGFIGKILVQVDEVKSMREHAEGLKNALTNPTMTWEAKGGKIATVGNYVNMVFTSNLENALELSTDDRRMVLFRCSSIYKGDKPYFDALGAHLKDPAVIAWFYRILKERSLGKNLHSMETTRPITAYYRESQMVNIPSERRFLAAVIHRPGPPEVTMNSSELYSMYRRWSEFEGNKNYKAHITFGRDVNRVNGVSLLKVGGVKICTIKKRVVKQYLESTNEYDAESYLNPEEH
jgi:hypothetical protein